MPVLVGRSLAWLNWGPRHSKHAPPAVLRGLMEALAIGITLWQAPPALDVTEETRYVDAAYDDHRWTAALWIPGRGMRIWRQPPWVDTQQGAELAAIEIGSKFSVYEGLTQLHVVADNMSAIRSAITNKSSIASPAQARHLRHIAHALR